MSGQMKNVLLKVVSEEMALTCKKMLLKGLEKLYREFIYDYQNSIYSDESAKNQIHICELRRKLGTKILK
jgi:hypothetical protein